MENDNNYLKHHKITLKMWKYSCYFVIMILLLFFFEFEEQTKKAPANVVAPFAVETRLLYCAAIYIYIGIYTV